MPCGVLLLCSFTLLGKEASCKHCFILPCSAGGSGCGPAVQLHLRAVCGAARHRSMPPQMLFVARISAPVNVMPAGNLTASADPLHLCTAHALWRASISSSTHPRPQKHMMTSLPAEFQVQPRRRATSSPPAPTARQRAPRCDGRWRRRLPAATQQVLSPIQNAGRLPRSVI